MRKNINEQMQFGEVDISEIKFDMRSRDEIPKLLMGLQYIYTNMEIRNEVFEILNEILPKEVKKDDGRPGMTMWEILVLGTIRLNCNWDYDKLKDIADNHKRIRLMLGISEYGLVEKTFSLQTLKDNVSLLTANILERINNVVVKAGHNLLKKKEEEIKLTGRCDSFVVETDVHFPTDINLLWDSTRKTIELTYQLSEKYEIDGWRQTKHLLKKTKKLFRKCQKTRDRMKRSKKNSEALEKDLNKTHRIYINECQSILERAEESIKNINYETEHDMQKAAEILRFIEHGKRQIDQIDRRIFRKEKIPQDEKIFSVFEEHTEWICKGKAGVSQELGVRVGIIRDQFGLILYHRVMKKETDDKAAVPILEKAKELYPQLISCSFDKGFWSPENKIRLSQIVDKLILPKKGRLSVVEKAEQTDDYIEQKRKHSIVESSINALENHGLDRCSDHGIEGFEKYVALAVLGRNIQILGNILQQKELERLKRLRNKHEAA